MPFCINQYALLDGDMIYRHQVANLLNALELDQSHRAAYAAGYTEALRRVALGLGLIYNPPWDCDLYEPLDQPQVFALSIQEGRP